MIEVIKVLEEGLNSSDYQWLLERINQPLESFQSLLRTDRIQNASMFDQPIKKILGIGAGSTPQSDDIFLGKIATMNLLEPDLELKLLILASYRFEEVTTKESSILIRRFLRKNNPDEILQFLEALKKNISDLFNKKNLKNEIQKVKSIGASSGTFFLVGVLWQLRYYENQN
ncbi:MAG: oxamate carbamoyltransferase subunit AllH family protein [Candidatus Hodarchaeales archaeon]